MHLIANGYKCFLKTNSTGPRQHVPLTRLCERAKSDDVKATNRMPKKPIYITCLKLFTARHISRSRPPSRSTHHGEIDESKYPLQSDHISFVTSPLGC